MVKFNVKKCRDFVFLTIAGAMFLIAFNLLAFLLVGDVNIDLTPDKKYSLSDKTMDFLRNNTQQINVRFFVSKDLKSKNPKLSEYAEYLRKLFVEYKAESNGLIDISFVDVVPFENSQSEAEKYDIKEFETGEGIKYQYLGASFSNINGNSQSISQFHPERRFFVEDDITRVLSIVAKKSKPYLGIISPLFSVADENNPIKPVANWPFVKNMEKFGYNIISLRSTTPVIDENIDVVLLLYPMNVSTSLVYALDQYLVKGGNVVIMMDSFSEERFKDLENYYGYRSGILNFLKKHGIFYNEDLIVGDNINSRSVVINNQKIKYPFLINITGDMLAKHPMTENINLVHYNHGGLFKYEEQDNMNVTVIAKTTDSSGVMLAEKMTDIGYDELLENYAYGGDNYILSLLVEGNFAPYYEYPPLNDKKLIEILPVFINISQKPGKLMVLGDADIVNEVLWNADAGKKNGVYDVTYSSDNLLFLRNIFDYMSTSGYVSVGSKHIENNELNLVDIFQRLAIKYYDAYYKDTLKQMAEVKDKLLTIELAKNEFDIKSIQEIKEKELLIRKETAIGLTLRKITYLIGEKYNLYKMSFSFLTVFLLPLLMAFVTWSVYMFYNRKIVKKAKEYIHE